MSDTYELITAFLSDTAGPNSTAVYFTVVDDVRCWAWLNNKIINTQVPVWERNATTGELSVDDEGNLVQKKRANGTLVTKNQVTAGTILNVEVVNGLGNVQTSYEKTDSNGKGTGEFVKLSTPRQQLLLGGKIAFIQPSMLLTPMPKLEVVSA